MCTMCVPGASRGEKRELGPWNWNHRWLGTITYWWKSNLGPLQKQQVLLIASHLSRPFNCFGKVGYSGIKYCRNLVNHENNLIIIPNRLHTLLSVPPHVFHQSDDLSQHFAFLHASFHRVWGFRVLVVVYQTCLTSYGSWLSTHLSTWWLHAAKRSGTAVQVSAGILAFSPWAVPRRKSQGTC